MSALKMKAPKLKSSRNVLIFAGAFFLMVMIVVAGLMVTQKSAFNDDPIWNSGSDKTDLVDTVVPVGNNGNPNGNSNGNNGGNGGSPSNPTASPDGTFPTATAEPTNIYSTPYPQSPSATPWTGPNPTPLPTWNPIGPTAPPTAAPTAMPTAVPTAQPTTAPTTSAQQQAQQQEQLRIKVWQTLYITNVDGPNYWVSPKQPFNMGSIFGSKSGTGSDFTLVKTMQNNIYMNIPAGSIYPYQVSSYSFHCKETIELQRLDGSIIKTVVSNADVDKSGNSPALSSNAWITGSSVDAYPLQKLLGYQYGGVDQANFVIKLTDIRLTITLTNGDVHTLTPVGSATSDNVLTWRISVIR